MGYSLFLVISLTFYLCCFFILARYLTIALYKTCEFETAISASLEEDRANMSAGYTYVTERASIKLWQRLKRFGKSVRPKANLENLINSAKCRTFREGFNKGEREITNV